MTATGRHLPYVVHCGNACLYDPPQQRDLDPWARETANCTSILSIRVRVEKYRKDREVTATSAIQISILSPPNSTCTWHSSVVSSRMPWACPPQSSIMCQHGAALKLISSDRFSENTGMQLPHSRMVHLLSAAPCLVSILNASLPLAVWGSQKVFFHSTNEGVWGAALASCRHLVCHSSFTWKCFTEIAITTDQLISSSVGCICGGYPKALGSFCPTLLRARQCNTLLMTVMVIMATEPFLLLQHAVAQSKSGVGKNHREASTGRGGKASTLQPLG